MISTQYLIGVPVFAAVLTAGMRLTSTAIEPNVGIVVHHLEFANDPFPAIAQHRTVTADNALFAGWDATITAQGRTVCHGGGSWDYPAGTKKPVIPVNEWVGQSDCWEKLPKNVTLQACAEYRWGDGEKTNACTLGFRKTE